MAQRLRAGVIWANTYNRFDPASPFGGYRSPASAPRAASTGSSLPGLRMSRLRPQDLQAFIGGEFPRSESPVTYEAEGQNVARGSRKDIRDSVRAARGAFRSGRR